MTFRDFDPAKLIRVCKTRTCRKSFHMRRGRSARFCPTCEAERIEEKKKRKIDRRIRVGKYPKPKVTWWKEAKKTAHRNKSKLEVEALCEICKMKDSECKKQFGCGLTRDHIFPVRFITEHGLGDPHIDLNIKLTCSGCGGKKTAAEVKLFNGDVLGFILDLKKWGWDMEEIKGVMIFYRSWSPRMEEHLK